MKPIATPIVSGMITSFVAVLIIVPALFMALKQYQPKRGTLRSRGGRGLAHG